jgi:predicted outer membrane protein
LNGTVSAADVSRFALLGVGTHRLEVHGEDPMKRTGLLWTAIVAVIIVFGGCSKNEGTKAAGPKSSGSEQRPERPSAVGTGGAGADVKSDGEFVHDIALMNMAEIELSHMALDKAVGADTKSFAQRIIDDHGAAASALKGIVSAHSIDWPAQLDEKHKKPLDDLAKKQGPDFDRDYAKQMVEAHQNLAAKLESRLDVQSLEEWKTAAAGRAQNRALPDPKSEMGDLKVRPLQGGNDTTKKINQWAADTYPIVQKDLDTARALENAAKKRSTN